MDAPTAHLGAASWLRGIIRGHPVTVFLVLAYAASWAIQVGAVRTGWSLRVGSSLGAALGLAGAAVLVTAADSGTDGVRDLLRRCVRWRVGPGWYAVALFGPIVATVAAAAVVLGPAAPEGFAAEWRSIVTVLLPEVVVAVALIQGFEEAAWAGFAQDRLQARHGPLLASLLVAPAFAASHLAIDLLESPGVAGAALLLAVQAVVAAPFRVVLAWLYNAAGRSVPVVAVCHAAFNVASGSGGTHYARIVLPAAPAWASLAALAVSALLVVLLTRGRLAGATADGSNRGAGTLRRGPAANVRPPFTG